MKLWLRAILLVPFLMIGTLSRAQPEDSSRLRISLLTCGPAGELYSIWGHTAIRVTDSASGADLVFNYGTFDISDPYFYIKFTRGIMRYALSVDNYTPFIQEYKDDHRMIVEQQLMLDPAQKERLFDLLEANAREEHRYYNYLFCEDNCTTRAMKIIDSSIDHSILFRRRLSGKAPSYRELIHQNLDSYHQYWSKFAIDFLLGSNLDKPAVDERSLFLPFYLEQGFDSAMVQPYPLRLPHPLVSENRILLKGDDGRIRGSLITPLVLFSALALGFILLSLSRRQLAKRILRIADGVFFFLLGILGVLLLFVWAGRVDSVCRNNWNILWAFPTHMVMVFFTRSKPQWVKNYFRVAALFALLLLLGWPWLPQQLNIGFAPLLVIIVLRGWKFY